MVMVAYPLNAALASHYAVLHYITLLCPALHCTKLNYTALPLYCATSYAHSFLLTPSPPQIYRFITEKMLLRSISAAMFHPLSRKGRKRTLHTIIQGRISRTNSNSSTGDNEHSFDGSDKQSTSGKDGDLGSDKKDVNNSVKSEKSINNIQTVSLMKIQQSPHTPEDFTSPYRAGFENLFFSGNQKHVFMGMMLLYYQSDALMSRDAVADCDGWESRGEEGSLHGEGGGGGGGEVIDTGIDKGKEIEYETAVEGNDEGKNTQGDIYKQNEDIYATWGCVEEEIKEKKKLVEVEVEVEVEKNLLEIPSVNAVTLLHALGILPLPTYRHQEQTSGHTEGAHTHSEGSLHSSSARTDQDLVRLGRLNEAQGLPSTCCKGADTIGSIESLPSLPSPVPACSVALNTPTPLYSSSLSVKVEEEENVIARADVNDVVISGSITSNLDVVDAGITVDAEQSDISNPNDASNLFEGLTVDDRYQHQLNAYWLSSKSNSNSSVDLGANSNSSSSMNMNMNKSKSRNPLVVIGEEVDDIEFLSEEEGLSALEPDVMSVYKLASIAQYLRHRSPADLKLSISSKKIRDNLNVRDSVQFERMTAHVDKGEGVDSTKHVNGEEGSESVCANSIGTTQFVDLELDSTTDHGIEDSCGPNMPNLEQLSDTISSINSVKECYLNKAHDFKHHMTYANSEMSDSKNEGKVSDEDSGRILSSMKTLPIATVPLMAVCGDNIEVQLSHKSEILNESESECVEENKEEEMKVKVKGKEGTEGGTNETTRSIAQTFTTNILQQAVKSTLIQSASVCDNQAVDLGAKNETAVSDLGIAKQAMPASLQSDINSDTHVTQSSKNKVGDKQLSRTDNHIVQHTHEEPSIFDNILLKLLEDNEEHSALAIQVKLLIKICASNCLQSFSVALSVCFFHFSLNILHCTCICEYYKLSYRTAIHYCTIIYNTSRHYTTLHYTTLHYTTLIIHFSTTQMGVRTIYSYVCLINSASKAIAEQHPDIMESILTKAGTKSCHDADRICENVTVEREKEWERERVCIDIASLSCVADRVHMANIKNTAAMAAQLQG